jgi:hypothetical protein
MRASCPGCLTAQLKGEKLMVIPSTADGFRAEVSMLSSLDGKEGVSFHTFSPQEDRCVQLVVKNPGRDMPESVIWEEFESLDIRVQGVTVAFRASRSGHRQGQPSHPTLHSVNGARTRGVKNAINHRNLRLASVGGVERRSKRPIAMQALPALRPHAA